MVGRTRRVANRVRGAGLSLSRCISTFISLPNDTIHDTEHARHGARPTAGSCARHTSPPALHRFCSRARTAVPLARVSLSTPLRAFSTLARPAHTYLSRATHVLSRAHPVLLAHAPLASHPRARTISQQALAREPRRALSHTSCCRRRTVSRDTSSLKRLRSATTRSARESSTPPQADDGNEQEGGRGRPIY